MIDADNKPLTASQIAKLLNYKPATKRKLLSRFESVKLIEKVDLPEFDLTKNEVDKKKNSKGGDTKKRGSRGQKRGRFEIARNTSEQTEKFQKPF
ncbi:hypothetical protein ACFLZ8_06390 [Planctomycetota bacterium]